LIVVRLAFTIAKQVGTVIFQFSNSFTKTLNKKAKECTHEDFKLNLNKFAAERIQIINKKDECDSSLMLYFIESVIIVVDFS